MSTTTSTAPVAVPTTDSSRRRRMVIGIVVVGVVLRLVAIGALGTSGDSLYEFGVIGGNLTHDRGYSYFSEAPNGSVHIDAAGTGHPLPSAFMPPGYTIIVAGAQAVTHSDTDAVRLLQLFNVLIGIATIVMSYLLATRLFGPRVGLWSSLAVAAYPVLLYQATQPSASNAYLPVDITTLYLLVGSVRRPSRATAAWAGVGIGVTCLFRAEALFLVPLLALWLAWALRRRVVPAAGRRTATLAIVGAFLVPAVGIPAAWMVRNSVALGHVTPNITTTGGFNLWIGNHAGASGSQKQYTAPSGSLEQSLNRLPATKDYEVRRDNAFMSAAVSYITHHPVATVTRDLKKLGMTLTFDAYDHRSRNVLYVGSWLVLAVLGVWGWCRRMGEHQDRALLLVFFVYALAIPTAFFTLARYKLQMELVLLLLSGCALVRIADAARAAWARRRHDGAAVRAS